MQKQSIGEARISPQTGPKAEPDHPSDPLDYMEHTNVSAAIILDDNDHEDDGGSFSFQTPSKVDHLDIPSTHNHGIRKTHQTKTVDDRIYRGDSFELQPMPPRSIAKDSSPRSREQNSADSSEAFVWEPSFGMESSLEVDEIITKRKPDQQENDSEVRRLNLLRGWLLFLVFCFTFEEMALEIPSWALIDPTTKLFIGAISVLTLINFVLLCVSVNNPRTLFAVAIIMQIAFVCCAFKTNHHLSSPENHYVVRIVCSGRLILMALETSQLSALACRGKWARYSFVNIINAFMFAVLAFLEFDFENAGLWDIGQVSSIFGSALVSLLLYTFLVERLTEEDCNDIERAKKEREIYKKILETNQTGVMILENSKVMYMNKLCNAILSKMFSTANYQDDIKDLPNFFEDNQQIDQHIFKLAPNCNGNKKVSMRRLFNDDMTFSLRDILLLPEEDLECLSFIFLTDDMHKLQSFFQAIFKSLKLAENGEPPRLDQFQIQKAPLLGETVNEDDQSFIVKFIEQRVVDPEKGQKELLSLINATISHSFRNPLNSIINQHDIIQMLLSSWRESWFPLFKKLIQDSKMKEDLYKFFSELSGAVMTC